MAHLGVMFQIERARWVCQASAQEVVGEVEVTGAVAGEASLLVDEAGAVQEVGVVGAHPGAGVVGVEEGGEEEAWVEERRLW